MKTYEITQGDIAVGSAQIIQEGLYYKICCRCRFSRPGLYRIYALTDKATMNLGICVPNEGHYSLTKRIPQKHFDCNTMKLIASEKILNEDTNVLAFEDGQPFAHIDKLENARIDFRNGGIYFVISNPADRP